MVSLSCGFARPEELVRLSERLWTLASCGYSYPIRTLLTQQ
jgi:hypothetical protein